MKHRKHSNWQEQTLLLLATTWSYLNHLANIRPHACFGKASVAFSHLDLLCDKMTSSTKLEVRMVLHCHQRRTEPRPQTKAYMFFPERAHLRNFNIILRHTNEVVIIMLHRILTEL